MPWIAASIGAGGSLLGGALGADAADDAAQAQLRAAREGRNFDMAAYLASLGINEPTRQTAGNATNALASMFGLPTQQYTPAADIARQSLQAGQASNTRLGAKAILKLLKQKVPLSEIAQMGSLKSNPGVIKKLAKKGLSADQISQLQAGPQFNAMAAPAAPAQSAAAPGAFPPGYNFFREEGQRDLLGAFGAGGQGAFSGNALKGLTEFNQNYADQKIVDPLFRLAGFGQGANQNAQQATQNFGQNQSNALNNMGDVRGSGIANSANIWGNAISGAAQGFGQAYGNRRPTGQQAYDDYLRAGQYGWGG